MACPRVLLQFSATVLLVESASLSTASREEALLQAWDKALDEQKQGADETPVTRVVNLLKAMQETLKKEMDEDEEMYEKVACWCSNQKYAKNEAIETAEQQIASLEAKIEQLSAKSAELKSLTWETTKELEADKEELAEASALRQKQLKEFHGQELDAIQNVENLKAAIIVLGKHSGAFPQISLLSVNTHHKVKNVGGGKAGWLDRQLDTFMRKNGYAIKPIAVSAADDQAVAKLLQEREGATQVSRIRSAHEKAVVDRAIQTATVFMQTKGEYTPPYASQSGEILGMLKQMKEEMESDLSVSQKTEASRAAAFDELRTAKTDEIASGEKLLEEKKDELAQTDFDLANAKEDLEQLQEQLAEDQKFLGNLLKTCEEADKNFELRKKGRLEEIKAVSETIEILTSEDARDAMNGAYRFIQMSMRTRRISGRRSLASRALRTAAAKTQSSHLSVLATAVELDAFNKIKALMNEMIQKLKQQQADEVKKNDWCKSEFQEHDMLTMKAEDVKQDQIVKIDDLGTAIQSLTEEIEAAKATIAQLQIDLQRAGETRVKENHEFQMTVADQVATQEILAKALDKLATFYDEEFLVQVGRSSVRMKAHEKQTPPVAQMDYKPSGGASGVMSMIEKLIYDAKELEADAKKSESESQAQYETFIADTSATLKDLSTAVVTKSEEVSKAEKEKIETEEALKGTLTDLQDLAKYKAGLHEECDYIMKNFGIRQEGRQAEIDAVQQAKQILSGAQ